MCGGLSYFCHTDVINGSWYQGFLNDLSCILITLASPVSDTFESRSNEDQMYFHYGLERKILVAFLKLIRI